MLQRNFKGQFVKGDPELIKRNKSNKQRLAVSKANRGEKHPMFGKHHSTKTKIKMSIARTGRKRPEISGSKHHDWKGGRIKCNGYIKVYMPEHPYSNHKYILEHHLVVEKILGRYLTKKECIHHINKITNDNRPENLYLFSSNSEHLTYHNAMKNNKIQPITKSNLIT